MTQPPYPEQPSNPQFPQNQMPHQQANSWMPQDGAPPAYLQQQYQPAWQMPQSPKDGKRTLAIVLGSVIGIVFLLVIVGFTFVNSLASNEAKKIENMQTIADRLIPGEDWTETFSMDPKVDPTCIPSNISCHRLQRTWEMPDPVSATEIESMLNIDFSGKSSWRGCSLGEENGLEIELCVPESDSPQVTLSIQD